MADKVNEAAQDEGKFREDGVTHHVIRQDIEAMKKLYPQETDPEKEMPALWSDGFYVRAKPDMEPGPEWVSAAKCPYCGKPMVLISHYSFSYNTLIGQNGELTSKRKKSTLRPLGENSVSCTNCGENWESDKFRWKNNKLFVWVRPD